MANKILRGYQAEAIEAINSKLKQGVNRQLLVLATGLGKTFTAVKAISPFKKRLWITHTSELLEQSGCAFLKEIYPDLDVQTMIDTYGGLSEYISAVKSQGIFSDMSENDIVKNVGIIKAQAFDISADIILASAQTLYRRLDKIPKDHFDAVVCDEAHMFASKTFNEPLIYLQPKLLLGCTATPYRMDGANLGDIFNEIVYQYNISDGIQDGYLCELDALQIQSRISLDNVRTLGGEFNAKELKETIDTPQRNKLLVDKYKQYADGKSNLVFCVDVEHAQNVCNEFKERGYRAEFIVGDISLSPDRKSIINRFKTGETQILINVQILTVGFDFPELFCITLACPTKSTTKFYQCIGRGTRILPNVIDNCDSPISRRDAIKNSLKPKCIILDIVDTTTKHRVVNTWTLEKSKPIEERVFTTKEKREILIDAREKRKFEAITKQDRRINLFELPKVKLSNSIKMTDPATGKQLDFLKNVGYDVTNNTYTKGSANEILSNLPASQKVINFLKWKGYDTNYGVTKAEATLAFKEIEEKENKNKIKKEIEKASPVLGIN